MQYNMEVIQEVDSSEANSIGFQTPRHKMEFFKFNSSNRMEDEAEEACSILSAKRQRSRPRSASENLFLEKTRIIDFLSEWRNK